VNASNSTEIKADRCRLQVKLVNKGQRPEQPYADDHCPACKARMGIAEIKKQTDRLRQRGAEEMRKDEISRQALFRTFHLRIIRNEPIDHPDKLIPHQHFAASP